MNTKYPFDVYQIRRDFPILFKKIDGHSLVYFDSAATTQKPRQIIETLRRFYLEEYGTVHRSIYPLSMQATEQYHHVRFLIKRLINAREEEEIVFTHGTTEGINLLASSLGKTCLNQGDEVLISIAEHHANFVPWQLLCQEKKCILKVAPINHQGELMIQEFSRLLSPKTKIVSLAHVTNVTGAIYPIKQITEMAHQVGAKVIIDGAQAASHLPVDVQDLDVDFYLFSGHKLYAPTGVGVLYGKKELLNSLPPFMTGSDMIEHVSLNKTTFQASPLRFEAGTPPFAQVIALGAAVKYIESIGLAAIADWEHHLLLYTKEKLRAMDEVHLIGDGNYAQGGIISLTIDQCHPLDVGTLLGTRGISVRTGHLCAQPLLQFFNQEALIRISFGLYNTYEEIDMLVDTLKEIISMIHHDTLKV